MLIFFRSNFLTCPVPLNQGTIPSIKPVLGFIQPAAIFWLQRSYTKRYCRISIDWGAEVESQGSFFFVHVHILYLLWNLARNLVLANNYIGMLASAYGLVHTLLLYYTIQCNLLYWSLNCTEKHSVLQKNLYEFKLIV